MLTGSNEVIKAPYLVSSLVAGMLTSGREVIKAFYLVPSLVAGVLTGGNEVIKAPYLVSSLGAWDRWELNDLCTPPGTLISRSMDVYR